MQNLKAGYKNNLYNNRCVASVGRKRILKKQSNTTYDYLKFNKVLERCKTIQIYCIIIMYLSLLSPCKNGVQIINLIYSTNLIALLCYALLDSISLFDKFLSNGIKWLG